ncbi:MAG TPA: LysE family translocator [Chloroflexia bacterium]|jgi:threonine/homoserine/homoserine lactone efflux protein
MDAKLWAFLLVSAVLTITPGVDMALVARSALSRGRNAAFMTTLGIITGLPVHAFLSAVGLSVILSQSALAFETVKLLGAGYLIYLGVRTIISAGSSGGSNGGKHGKHGKHVASEVTQPQANSRAETRRLYLRSYVEGLLNNLLNPKVALFYLTFLPQFMSPGDPVIARSVLMGLIHAAEGIIWLMLYAYFLTRLSAVMNRPGVRRNIERVTGLLLVGLGVRLVWEKR